MSQNNDEEKNKLPITDSKIARWIPILGFIIIVALGIFAGFKIGIGQRMSAQATVVARQVEEQYQLGLEAMNNGQYEVAYQHFQFVVTNAPNYPGLQQALTQLAIWISTSPTPSPTPSPTITPTPDTRAAQSIFAQAQQFITSQDWSNAINTLDALRKSDPTFRTVDVDGMYYMALRGRGMGKILPASCKDANLEGGIYDLTLAERFGPLDGNAAGLRNFARYYLAGAAFWEVDWKQAQYYFAQVYPYTPNLMDSSCQTAQDRWRHATLEYAKQLLDSGDYCGAQAQFEAGFAVYSEENVPLFPTATSVYLVCFPPTATHPHLANPTATPSGGPPTPTPTP